jgi:hypothetical protein
MSTLRILSAFVLGLVLNTSAFSDELPLSIAQGVVEKADKETVTIKPRGANGQFQKTLVLSVMGTSKVTVLTPQKRTDKIVLTQREADAKDLAAGQAISAIYTSVGKDQPVLLSAVVQAAK